MKSNEEVINPIESIKNLPPLSTQEQKDKAKEKLKEFYLTNKKNSSNLQQSVLI